MMFKSYSRITLALDIISRLKSGYHELETIKHKIELHDEIEIEKSSSTIVECDKIKDTIILKTINALKDRYRINENVHVTVKKNVPVCGGLAGGSSNAATVLMALNKMWKINAPQQELVETARSIGMDVPCFLFNGLIFDREIDNSIEEIGKLPKAYVVIVNNGINVPTKDAYSWIDYSKIGLKLASRKIRELKNKKELISLMHNDFEQFVFARYPPLRKIKEQLNELGLNALMSGSGSTIFGITFNKSTAESAYEKIKDEYEIVRLTKTK